MTRPSKNSLVLDGSEIKYRLEAERLASNTSVHVDWFRFTVLRRNAPFIGVENLFPLPYMSDRKEPQYLAWVERTTSEYRVNSELTHERNRLAALLASVPDHDFLPCTQARELADSVCAALGRDFVVNAEIKKGHDFYKFRWSIERMGAECGWVGFLASGDSPRQKAQAATVHCNLYGMACTFAEHGWRDRLADIVEELNGVVTRCDLALDFFDGYPGGIKAIENDYNDGLCNVGGKRLLSNYAGDWSAHSQGGRSLYFGSKEAGKQTNAYEKGDQLFGVGNGSPWLRVELRYGNKLRILPLDMLRRPADFFAGASDWHAAALLLAGSPVVPEHVPAAARLPLETVEAECARNIRWNLRVAAPSVALAFKHLGIDEFLEFVTNQKLPGRLKKFLPSELARGVVAAFGRISQPESSPAFVMA